MSCVELSDKFEQEALVVQHKGVSSINVSGEGFPAQFCFLIRGQEIMSECLSEVGISQTGVGVCFICLSWSLLL